jgi:hypothetical protein
LTTPVVSRVENTRGATWFGDIRTVFILVWFELLAKGPLDGRIILPLFIGVPSIVMRPEVALRGTHVSLQ